MKQVIIEIPEEIKKAFKAKAALNNTTMTELIRKAIYKYVEKKKNEE